jgi:Domain of unknown function DUF302
MEDPDPLSRDDAEGEDRRGDPVPDPGACIPTLAYQALGINPALGALLPCRVIIYETEDGTTRVAPVDTVTMLALVGRAEFEAPTPGAFAEPSGGLEPPTPSGAQNAFAADFHSRRRCAMSWARSSSLPPSSTWRSEGSARR